MAPVTQGEDQTFLTCTARSAEVCGLREFYVRLQPPVGNLGHFPRRVAAPLTPTRAFHLAPFFSSRALSPSRTMTPPWSKCCRADSMMVRIAATPGKYDFTLSTEPCAPGRSVAASRGPKTREPGARPMTTTNHRPLRSQATSLIPTSCSAAQSARLTLPDTMSSGWDSFSRVPIFGRHFRVHQLTSFVVGC